MKATRLALALGLAAAAASVANAQMIFLRGSFSVPFPSEAVQDVPSSSGRAEDDATSFVPHQAASTPFQEREATSSVTVVELYSAFQPDVFVVTHYAGGVADADSSAASAAVGLDDYDQQREAEKDLSDLSWAMTQLDLLSQFSNMLSLDAVYDGHDCGGMMGMMGDEDTDIVGDEFFEDDGAEIVGDDAEDEDGDDLMDGPTERGLTVYDNILSVAFLTAYSLVVVGFFYLLISFVWGVVTECCQRGDLSDEYDELSDDDVSDESDAGADAFEEGTKNPLLQPLMHEQAATDPKYVEVRYVIQA